MPIDYALDRPCRLLRLTAHEDVRLDDLLVVFVRRARESAWPFGVVLDVRECPCSLSGAEMSLVVTRTRGLSAERGAPGPLAIVMPQNGRFLDGVLTFPPDRARPANRCVFGGGFCERLACRRKRERVRHS